MQTRKRWQDVAPLVIGALLLLTPLAFGLAAISSPSLAAWILGAVVGVGAIALALLWFWFPASKVTEGTTVLLGLVLFVSPWVLGLTAGAWASSVLGELLIVAAVRMLVENRSHQARLAAYRAAYLDSRSYRRVSSSM